MLIADRATAPLARALRAAPFHLVATLLVALALLAAPQAQAQETSTQIVGRVIDSTGAPVAGATIVVTHAPSGTVSEATSNADGRFSTSGLRVGGPYTVEVRKDGFESLSYSQVFTQLGQPVALSAGLRRAAVEEVVVTSTRQEEFTLGVASQFTLDDIVELPSVSRDVKDIVRLDPKIKIDTTNSDALEIAGSSPRYNSLTIDGVRQSDDFGLNNNGYPTQRSPVSLDAIEAVSVQTAPYDVQYGFFQGATINMVTKSGGNDFHGAGYYYSFDDGLIGDKSRNDPITPTFDEKTYGANLGGPILRDRLFFFVSYEKLERTTGLDFGPAGSGAPIEVARVSQADYNQIVSIAQSVYGFDAGQPQSSLPEEDEKILAKLDWNIIDGHRATLAYQRSEGNENIDPNSNATTGRVSTLSNYYNRGFKLESLSFQLFSDWTENFSTEFKVARKEVSALQAALSGTDFAEMEITTTGGGIVHVGPDRFRHANAGANDLDTFKLKGELTVGNHTLVAGYELEKLDIFNLFVSESEGRYFFDCITPTAGCTNAFSTRRARELRYNNHVSNNKQNGAASFQYDVQSFYVQDRWQVTPQLALQAGLRYDRYSSSDSPTLNQNFVARNGFSNQGTYDGLDLLSPRLGFDLLFSDATSVYGGVGLYGGGTPNVWLSNSFSTDGVSIASTTINATSSAALQSVALQNVNGLTIPAAVQALILPGNGSVNALASDFEIPSSWRYSLGVRHRADLGFLGEDYRFTAEAIRTQVQDSVLWRDLRRVRSGTAPDGRPIYSGPAQNDLVLFNTGDGESTVFSVDVSKTWRTAAGRFDAYLGYAYTDASDVHPATSSTAFSNWGRVARTDLNNPVLATSNYETRHRFPLSVTWRKAFFGDYESGVSLFVERRSGRPYSLTFGGGSTGFGDPTQSNEFGQLLYIPANPTDIDYGSTTTAGVTRTLTSAQFQDFVSAYGLDKYRGGFVPRNALRSPWVTAADMRFSQQIPAFFKTARGVFTVDIENVANLLNDKWGRVAQVAFPHTAPVVDMTIQPNGRYLYRPVAGVSGVQTPTFALGTPAIQSVWRIQLGVRFEF